jgi:hypothetical protein
MTNKQKVCPIDGSQMAELFAHRVLGKYEAQYFMCSKCGVVQTEEPYWLAEAYSSPISSLDTWGAARNIFNAKRLAPVLDVLFQPQDSFVDAACGYGLFVRLMRDIGYDFHGHDDFCQNLFSRSLPPLRNPAPAAVTCFEVLEHLIDPVAFLSGILEKHSTDSIIASTTVFSGSAPDKSWPYYSFESGQHLSLYQASSLKAIARRLGLSYISLGDDLHLFSSRRFNPLKLRFLRCRRFRSLIRMLNNITRRHRSLTFSDYEFIRNSILGLVGDHKSAGI